MLMRTVGHGNPYAPGKVDCGFTLTELLVVVVMAGILAGIAAPGWLAFMNRQRVGGAQTELLQFMREAQAQSIAKRSSYGIEFEGEVVRLVSAKGARVNGTGEIADATQLATIKEEKLGSSDGAALEIKTEDGKNRIYFNFDGSVPPQLAVPYAVSVQLPGEPKSRRCIVIETLLGSMREGSGETECPAN